MGEMQVAPFNSCVVCFKGDVSTAVGFIGEAEWLMAGLEVAGVPNNQAIAMVERQAAEQYGCDAGHVPEGEMQMAMRICPECAAKANFPVGETQRRDPDAAGAG